MVKFFLRNDKNLPKSQQSTKDSNSNKKKQKNKKVIDYRIVIWKKLFNLIKVEHSLMIQKLIRKIKEKKEKLILLQQQKQDNQEKIASITKQLIKLDASYDILKQQKKQQLKLITLYIIIQVLKIQNIQKILQKAKLSSNEIDIKQIKQLVENNDAKKKFVEKLSILTVYQEELEKCAQLVDVVQEKKLERKEKLKEKKTRKYQKEHGIKTESQKNQNQTENKNKNKDVKDSIEQVQESIEEQVKPKPNPTYNEKPFTKKINHSKSNDKNFKSFDKQQSFQQKHKPIQKQHHQQRSQRTQFKKTGRNKVKFQKQQRKHPHHKGQNNQYQKGDQKGNQHHQNQQPKKSNNKQFNFSKQMAHPSWQAKQQQKQQVFIKPFQGKKILL